MMLARKKFEDEARDAVAKEGVEGVPRDGGRHRQLGMGARRGCRR